MDKPSSPACARNAEPILAILRERLVGRSTVLEIGSGTGQHAVLFAAALPWLQWQSSDRAEHMPGIRLWLDEAALANTLPPLVLDVNGAWPTTRYDAVFSANTLHILAWPSVQQLFATLPAVLVPGGLLIVYGPFNYAGHFTSPSNAAFDAALKAQDQAMGIRDFEAVFELAEAAGLRLLEDHAMPANNRCLVWQAAA